MRDIKFRAWDKTKKRMFTSKHSYVRFGGNVHIHVKDPWNDCPQDGDIVLMQYTGLKDKSGREIYEGDVVIINDIRWEVVWDEYQSRLYLMPKSQPQREFDKAIDVFCVDCETENDCRDEIEVIGNIHENGDLLK